MAYPVTMDKSDDVKQRKGWRSPFQNIVWFMCFYYLSCLGVWAALSNSVVITRTLEKRFGLSATQSGFLLSMNDIVNMVLVLFIGYLGSKLSKARFLGCLCLVGGLGSLLWALPYPLFPVGLDFSNSTNTNNPLLCGLTPERDDRFCQTESTASENSYAAYNVMLASSAILGFACAGLGVLSVTYIDENVPPGEAAFYIGIASSANTVGPLLGFLLAGYTLSLPENLSDSVVDPESDAFIGCWWLPFIIWGACIILGAIGMIMCPSHLPYYYEQLEKERRENGPDKAVKPKGKQSFKEVMQETLVSLKSVFTNMPYLLLVISTLFAYYLVPGLYSQVPKYLAIHFKITASMTSIYTGGAALILSITLVITGFCIKLANLQMRGSVVLFTVGILGTCLSIGGMMPWECEQTQLAGAVDVTTKELPYYPECSLPCNCTGVQPMCSPIDDLSFASPCHAGCRGVSKYGNKTVFTDCLCVHGDIDDPTDSSLGQGYVEGGICPKGLCDSFLPYLVFFGLLNVFAAMTRLSAVMLQLRLIEKKMRPFGMGLTSFIHNGLAFVPGPIMFGVIFDSVCVLWQELECGVKGACIKYNMNDYRYYMHGLSLGFQGLALLLVIPLYVMIRPLFNEEQESAGEIFTNAISNKADKESSHQNGKIDIHTEDMDNNMNSNSGNHWNSYDNTALSYDEVDSNDTKHNNGKLIEVTEL